MFYPRFKRRFTKNYLRYFFTGTVLLLFVDTLLNESKKPKEEKK